MALTLLTDSYDSIANIDTYWAARGGTDWAALTDANKEIYIRKATDWIDRNFNFIGYAATSAQRLAWPREQAIDRDDYLLANTDAPWQVKEACAIVADLYRAGTYDLEGVITDDAGIIKTVVDVIEVEYDSRARRRGADSITHVNLLLGPLSTGNELLRS